MSTEKITVEPLRAIPAKKTEALVARVPWDHFRPERVALVTKDSLDRVYVSQLRDGVYYVGSSAQPIAARILDKRLDPPVFDHNTLMRDQSILVEIDNSSDREVVVGLEIEGRRDVERDDRAVSGHRFSDRRMRSYLGFDLGLRRGVCEECKKNIPGLGDLVLPGAVRIFYAQPQITFRPDVLFAGVPREDAKHFVIRKMFVGVFLLNREPVRADERLALERGGRLEPETIQVAQQVTIEVENISDRALPFRPCLVGETLR